MLPAPGATLRTLVTNTPHDAVFKAVFEQPEHAAAELQHVLSADLVAAIDWSSLALEPGSFVDEELADQHSDLVEDLVATLLDHLFAIAYATDNLVAVRYGESGEEFNLSKHSRPKDLQDVAAKLLDAEEQGRGEPE